jgi:hypothetical protein
MIAWPPWLLHLVAIDLFRHGGMQHSIVAPKRSLDEDQYRRTVILLLLSCTTEK